MKARHTSWMTLSTLLLFMGCGVGTEIGNGFKPDDGKAKSGKADKTADNANTAPRPDGSEAPVQADSEMGGDVEPGYTFDVNLVFSTCGSPFAATLASPARFSGKNADGVEINAFTATLNPDGAWEIRNQVDEVFRKVSNFVADDVHATITNAAGDPTAVDYTCTPLVATDGVTVDGLNGSYRHVQTTVTHSEFSANVAWYLDAATPPKLVRITVTNANGEADPIVLDAKAPE